MDTPQPTTLTLSLLWSDSAEAAYQVFAKANQGGVFPATREYFLIAALGQAGIMVFNNDGK